MRKFWTIIVLALLIAAIVTPAQAAPVCPPPGLPSSFYGYTADALPGANVSVYDGSRLIIQGRTSTYQGKTVYSLDAPAADACTIKGGREGDRLTFWINGRSVGSGVWHGGTNQQLDLTLVKWLWR